MHAALFTHQVTTQPETLGHLALCRTGGVCVSGVAVARRCTAAASWRTTAPESCWVEQERRTHTPGLVDDPLLQTLPFSGLGTLHRSTKNHRKMKKSHGDSPPGDAPRRLMWSRSAKPINFTTLQSLERVLRSTRVRFCPSASRAVLLLGAGRKPSPNRPLRLLVRTL